MNRTATMNKAATISRAVTTSPAVTSGTGTTNRRQRARFAAFGAAIAALLGAGGVLTSSAAGPVASSFVPITPCRLFDTRPGSDNVGTRATPVGNNDTYFATVWGANGNCNIPTSATGVSMNVSIISPTAASFLTVYPGDQGRPLAANLNWVAGQAPTPNAVTAALSASGTLGFYNLSGTVHLAVDVVGYYEAATSAPAGAAGPAGVAGPAGANGPVGPAGAVGPVGPVTRISRGQIGRLRWDTDPARPFTVTAGIASPTGVAFDGTNVWVANDGANTVSKLNRVTGAVVGSPVPVGASPVELGFDGTFLWVIDAGGSVTKVDAVAGTALGTVPLAGNPSSFAFDGTYVWVGNSASNTLSRINAATLAVDAAFATVELGPSALVYAGGFIWSVNTTDNSVSKVNPSTAQVDPAIAVGPAPTGVAFDGDALWVSSSTATTMARIDIATGAVVLVNTGGGTATDQVAYDGSWIWATSANANVVFRIDPAEQSVVEIDVGTGPDGVVFDGMNIWIANNGSNSVSKVRP